MKTFEMLEERHEKICTVAEQEGMGFANYIKKMLLKKMYFFSRDAEQSESIRRKWATLWYEQLARFEGENEVETIMVKERMENPMAYDAEDEEMFLLSQKVRRCARFELG